MKVIIYLTACLHCLILPFTETFTQSVKRRMCLCLEVPPFTEFVKMEISLCAEIQNIFFCLISNNNI